MPERLPQASGNRQRDEGRERLHRCAEKVSWLLKERFMRFGKFLTRACISLLVAVLVFLSTMTLPLMQSPVAAQSNGKGALKAPHPASKLSDDLRKQIGKSKPTDEISAIVQTSGKPSRLLQDDMKRQGG